MGDELWGSADRSREIRQISALFRLTMVTPTDAASAGISSSPTARVGSSVLSMPSRTQMKVDLRCFYRDFADGDGNAVRGSTRFHSTYRGNISSALGRTASPIMWSRSAAAALENR